ncbi:hypothetical protein BKA82DRAFT_3967344, partial [Pisolithus tinctorius]
AVPLKRAAGNPFFNAHENPIIRSLLPNITANPFANLYSITAPPIECTTNPLFTGNARALQSLIVTLETSPAEVEEYLHVISVQSSVYAEGSYLAS